MKLGMGKHDSLVAILNFGTNDILQQWDTVTGSVCHVNFIKLKPEYCSTCKKNSRIRNSRKRVPLWEHYPENRATREFRSINKIHSFVTLE